MSRKRGRLLKTYNTKGGKLLRLMEEYSPLPHYSGFIHTLDNLKTQSIDLQAWKKLASRPTCCLKFLLVTKDCLIESLEIWHFLYFAWPEAWKVFNACWFEKFFFENIKSHLGFIHTHFIKNPNFQFNLGKNILKYLWLN